MITTIILYFVLAVFGLLAGRIVYDFFWVDRNVGRDTETIEQLNPLALLEEYWFPSKERKVINIDVGNMSQKEAESVLKAAIRIRPVTFPLIRYNFPELFETGSASASLSACSYDCDGGSNVHFGS